MDRWAVPALPSEAKGRGLCWSASNGRPLRERPRGQDGSAEPRPTGIRSSQLSTAFPYPLPNPFPFPAFCEWDVSHSGADHQRPVRHAAPADWGRPGGPSLPSRFASQLSALSYSKNALCKARRAVSPLARSMITETLISLVEIMSMFTCSCARTSNIFAATPE